MYPYCIEETRMAKHFLILPFMAIIASGQTEFDLFEKYYNAFIQCDSSLQLVVLATPDPQDCNQMINALSLILKVRNMQNMNNSCQFYINQVKTLLICYDEMETEYDKEVIGMWVYASMVTMEIDLNNFSEGITEMLSDEKNAGLVQVGKKLKNIMDEMLVWLLSIDDNYKRYFEDPAPFRRRGIK